MYKHIIFLLLSSFVLIVAHYSETYPEPTTIYKSTVSYDDQLLYKMGNRYVDDQQCGMCHGDLYESFQEVGMSQSFYRPGEQALIEDFENNNTYYHTKSKRYFEMTFDEELFFRRYQIDTKGDTINDYRRKVDWVMGSGNKSRSYIYQTTNGELYLLPIAWYTDNNNWRMAPGFDSRNEVILNRQIQRECMFCHNAYPKELDEERQYHWEQDVFSHDLPSGIGCQRCHGPGGDHIDNVIMTNNDLEKINGSIVNPRKLPPNLRDDVCNQCHLQPTIAMMGMRKFDHGDYSFKPGEHLSSYIVQFDIDEADMPREERFEINHHAYRLYQSQCYTQSFGKLGCISCHDPHVKLKEVEKISHFKSVCTSCHEPHQRYLSEGAFGKIAMDDCISCHMQQQRNQDVIHTYTTDHLISVPSKEHLLAERSEKDHIIVALDIVEMDSIPEGPLGQAYIASAAVRSFGQKSAVDYLAKMLIAADVQEITPYLYLAKGQMGLGLYKEALNTYDKVLSKDSENELALLQKGVCLLRLRKKEQALNVFEQLVDIDSLNANAFYNMGILFESKKQYKEAKEAFSQTIQLKMEFAHAHLHLGICLIHLNEFEEAKNAFINAMQIDPTLDRAYALIGKLLMNKNKKEEALKYWKRGIEFGSSKDVILKEAANFDISLE